MAKPTLDTPLAEFEFPARVSSLIARRALTTLRDVVALSPQDLLAEKNFGRTSVAELRATIESVTGERWEDARAALLHLPPPAAGSTLASVPPPSESVHPPSEPSWSRLRAALDDARRDLPLVDLPELPTRIRSFAAARGLATLGELLDVPVDELHTAPNLGRKSVADTIELVAALLAAPPPVPPSLDDHADLSALWRAQLGALDRIDRLVLQHRGGFDAPAATLAEVGEMLGVSRERVRQIEVRALRAVSASRWWVDALDARIAGHLADGAIALDELASRDPWLASVRDDRGTFDLVSDRLLDGRYAVVRLAGREHLARFPQAACDRAWSELDDALAATGWPATRASVDARIAALGGPLGAVATAALRARAYEQLAVDPDDDARIVGYGGARDREIRLWVTTAGRPVPVAELAERFGRGHWPDDLVFVERGVLTSPELLDGFVACAQRVGPLCVARMTAEGPDRQWSCHELAEALRGEADLPAWFGPWPLGALLQRCDGLRYLGRGIVALPHVEGERVHQRGLLVSVLEEAGGPLPSAELRTRAGARRAIHATGFESLLQRAPFVEVGEGVYGLDPRDVPGGAAAVQRATDGLAATLSARGCGMSLAEALRRLRAGHEAYDGWTETLLRSVCAQDARLQTSASRALGLAGWEGLRIPTRAEVVEQALADGGGHAEVAVVQAKVEALYGETLSRATIASYAWKVGARLDGDSVVARDADARSSRPPPLLAGLPDGASTRFESLLATEFPAEDLRPAVEARARRFFLDAVTNEEVDLSRVVEAQRACESLLARTDGTAGERRRYAEAAVRYFVLSEEGAWDFTAHGLDDDLAVLRAVSARLDAAET